MSENRIMPPDPSERPDGMYYEQRKAALARMREEAAKQYAEGNIPVGDLARLYAPPMHGGTRIINYDESGIHMDFTSGSHDPLDIGGTLRIRSISQKKKSFGRNFLDAIGRNPGAFVLFLFSLFWPTVIVVALIARSQGWVR